MRLADLEPGCPPVLRSVLGTIGDEASSLHAEETNLPDP